MYQAWPRSFVAPGITNWAGLARASAANIGPIPPKYMRGTLMPIDTAARTIRTSFRTLTHATARTPLTKTNPATRATAITMA